MLLGTFVFVFGFRTPRGALQLRTLAGRVVYVGSDDRALYALRADSGAELWHATTGGAVRLDTRASRGGGGVRSRA